MRPVDKPFPSRENLTFARGSSPWTMNADEDPLAPMRQALQNTIGSYCSFCEMPLLIQPGVSSKHLRELQTTPSPSQWTDLLLACDFCQLHRSSDVFNLSLYLWPDVDTTFSFAAPSPFAYEPTQVTVNIVDEETQTVNSSVQTLIIVSPNPLAGPTAEKNAHRTIDLWQLNTPFYNPFDATYTLSKAQLLAGVDQRVFLRTRAWEKAIWVMSQIAESTPEYVEAMVLLASGVAQETGFWSTWITAFAAAQASPELVEMMFVQTSRWDDYILTGYQTAGPAPWTIFTGTAVARLGK